MQSFKLSFLIFLNIHFLIILLMEQFDLTVFKIGLEQGVFDHLQLMDFIYGGIKLTRKENNNLFFVLYVSHFNSLVWLIPCDLIF